MEFCEKCGGMIVSKEEIISCVACGYRPKKKPKIRTSEKIDKQARVAVVKDTRDNVHPVVEMKCPQCKHKKCYFWSMQTRASDESETKFYKCTNCKHTWRVYR